MYSGFLVLSPLKTAACRSRKRYSETAERVKLQLDALTVTSEQPRGAPVNSGFITHIAV